MNAVNVCAYEGRPGGASPGAGASSAVSRQGCQRKPKRGTLRLRKQHEVIHGGGGQVGREKCQGKGSPQEAPHISGCAWPWHQNDFSSEKGGQKKKKIKERCSMSFGR